MKRLSSTDRKALIRLASALPKGSEERKAILSGIQKTSGWAYHDPDDDVPYILEALENTADTFRRMDVVPRSHEDKRDESHDKSKRKEFWKRLRKAYLQMAKDLAKSRGFAKDWENQISSQGKQRDARAVKIFFSEALDDGAGDRSVMKIMAEMDKSGIWETRRWRGLLHDREYREIGEDAQDILLRATRRF